jgi:hypothetical protein
MKSCRSQKCQILRQGLTDRERLARDGKSHDGSVFKGHEADRGTCLEVESIGT